MNKTLVSWSSGKDSAWLVHVLRGLAGIELGALLTTINEPAQRVAMHAVRVELLQEQAKALALGQAHDPPRIRPVHAIPADASVRSANTNPSRSMMTPVSTGIGRLNIGPR